LEGDSRIIEQTTEEDNAITFIGNHVVYLMKETSFVAACNEANDLDGGENLQAI